MTFPDRMLLSINFIVSRGVDRNIDGQRWKSLVAFLVFITLLAGNYCLLTFVPKHFVQSLPLPLLGLGVFVLFVCPMFLVWPIVATTLLRVDLEKTRR
jgi:hypothetical protein